MATSAITPVKEPIPTTWSASLERLLPLIEWSSVRAGSPPADEAVTWLSHEMLTDSATARRLTQALAKTDEYATNTVPESIIGNYLFRDLIGPPLGLMGYLWAREQRVPLMTGNAVAKDSDWLQHWHWLEPAGIAIEGDPISSSESATFVPDLGHLNDALFEEVHRFSEPILGAFRKNRYVAIANGWGSILDAVAYGVQVAGQRDADLGPGGAWARWEAAIEGRTFPVRRRPRRLQYEWSPGCADDVLVRAGCCLWYMTDDAKGDDGATDYCTSCYLKTDEKRIASMVEWKREEAAGDVESH